MNKAQLVAQLQEKYEKVAEPQLVSDVNGVKTYDTLVFQIGEKETVQRTVPFYVVEEGTENESAYLRHPEQVDTFADYITSQTKGDVKKIVVTNKTADYAEVTAFVLVNGIIEKQNKFILKTGDTFEIYPLA